MKKKPFSNSGNSDTRRGDKKDASPRSKDGGNRPFKRDSDRSTDRPERGSGYGGDKPQRPYKPGGSSRPTSDRPERGGGYGDKPQRPYKAGGSSRPASDRPERGGGYGDKPQRPYKAGGSSRPASDRPERGGYGDGADKRKSFSDRDTPKRPYKAGDSSARPERSSGYGDGADKRKSFSDRDTPKRPYKAGGSRPTGDRPERSSYGDGPDKRKSFSDRDTPKRPYKAGGSRPTGDRPERSSYGDSPDKRKFSDRDTPKRPYKAGGSRPTGDRPERSSYGDGPDKRKSFSDGDKPKRPYKAAGSRSTSERPDRPERGSSFDDSADEKPKTERGYEEKKDVTGKPRGSRVGAEKREVPGDKPVNEEENEEQEERKPRRRRKPVDDEDEEEEAVEVKPMTLNKYIAYSGECSRRDAGELVKQGKVTVNGALVTDPGYRINTGDEIMMNGKKLTPQRDLAYILLNKPKGFITTTEDPEGRKTVMDLVANSGVERLYPVGRLDRNTTGLLLLTNDGDLAQKLSHPSYETKKVYQVTLESPLTKADFEKIVEGVMLEDGLAQVDEIAYLDTKNEIGLEIHSGRNRIVRRIFESLGYTVEKLDRMMYAGLTKKNLPRSKWRFLTDKEIILLKHFKI